MFGRRSFVAFPADADEFGDAGLLHGDAVEDGAGFHGFVAQVEQGGAEAPREVDTDYVRALAHAMPPAAGMGISIDRLTMLLTDSH